MQTPSCLLQASLLMNWLPQPLTQYTFSFSPDRYLAKMVKGMDCQLRGRDNSDLESMSVLGSMSLAILLISSRSAWGLGWQLRK